jgi:hypothetical protein
MYDMIEPYTENIHDYNLRQQISGDNFRLPFCNTVSNSKSFIPCTLRLWNVLPASTKSSPSLNIFKTRLNSDTKASPKYFHIGDRKENIIHCQMRNDASNLNLHLQQHHLSDRPSCTHCNDPCESSSHYFMHCPLYNIHRQQLVDSFNKLNLEFTIQTILYGSETSDYNQNVKLFRAVHSFIKRSKRFDNNIVIQIIFLNILNYNSMLTYDGP